MVLLKIDNDIFSVEFKPAISLTKKDSSFFYGCPIHQKKTENFCEECKKFVKTERIYLEEPIQRVKLNEVKADWTNEFPIYAMVENGFGWVIAEERLKQKLIEKKQLLTFKFIEKGGLNSKELDNFIFIYQNHLARIRCDIANKSLVGYDFVSLKREMKKKTVNVMKKVEAK